MTFTLLRLYPAPSSLASDYSSTTLSQSHTSCISVASCSCYLSYRKRSASRGTVLYWLVWAYPELG